MLRSTVAPRLIIDTRATGRTEKRAGEEERLDRGNAETLTP
jgi:hypothetical protein